MIIRSGRLVDNFSGYHKMTIIKELTRDMKKENLKVLIKMLQSIAEG